MVQSLVASVSALRRSQWLPKLGGLERPAMLADRPSKTASWVEAFGRLR